MAKKSRATIRRQVYSQFRGADFSTDPSLVAYTRSPLCTNIIADGGGMPQKRVGWRTLHTVEQSGERKAVYGLFYGVFNGAVHRLAHVGTKLYRWTDGGITELLSGLPEHKSRAAYMKGMLWIVTGSGYFCYDGTTASRVSERADVYVPTTTITRMPAGGGMSYEDVNMLTPYRKNAFQTDGTAVMFTLDGTVDETGSVRVWVWGQETADFTVDRVSGTVTLASAPPAPEAGNADGLVVQFPHTVAGYTDEIDQCTIITTYGVGNNDRIVLSGNPAKKNVDWISGFNDPTYIPDLGYATVGTEATAIRGYCRVGSCLGIVKEDNGQDSTVFLRSGVLDGDGNGVFSIAQAITGVGAVGEGSFAVLLDDPLFLSRTGVIALTSNDLTSEKLTVNRSDFLNAKLLTEVDREKAEAAVWNGRYLLAFPDGHVYVLDGKQEKSYRSGASWNYRYEGFYWENIPAITWLCDRSGEEEELYFGTGDGRICKFNSDVVGMAAYSDDGEAIDAVWATKFDDDGTPALMKTLLKRGCCVTIKPHARSSGTVYFRSDRTNGEEKRIAYKIMDILNFEDIDFERFTFSTDDAPQEIFLNRKVKNYKRLQILVRNSEVNEGFGIFRITKHFVVGNYAKR